MCTCLAFEQSEEASISNSLVDPDLTFWEYSEEGRQHRLLNFLFNIQMKSLHGLSDSLLEQTPLCTFSLDGEEQKRHSYWTLPKNIRVTLFVRILLLLT